MVEPRKRVTRLTNKLRLNAKARLELALKSTKPVYVDFDTSSTPMKKKRVKFDPMIINPLFQLAEVAEKIKSRETSRRHGRQRKKMKWN